MDKPKQQCSAYVMVAYFRDHPCRIPATTLEDELWWCSRHSKEGQRRARHRAKAKSAKSRIAYRDPVQ